MARLKGMLRVFVTETTRDNLRYMLFNAGYSDQQEGSVRNMQSEGKVNWYDTLFDGQTMDDESMDDFLARFTSMIGVDTAIFIVFPSEGQDRYSIDYPKTMDEETRFKYASYGHAQTTVNALNRK